MTKANKIKQLLIASKRETGVWFLFDWKTAPRINSLIYNMLYFDWKEFDCFNCAQLKQHQTYMDFKVKLIR